MQHRSRFVFSVLAVALGLAFEAPVASAQINPFRQSDKRIDLTQEDMQLMSRAVDSLTSGTAVPGQKAAWENPNSGTSGTIEIVRIFERQGMPCQKRRYSFQNARKFGTNTFILDLCKVPSGEWKIV